MHIKGVKDAQCVVELTNKKNGKKSIHAYGDIYPGCAGRCICPDTPDCPITSDGEIKPEFAD